MIQYENKLLCDQCSKPIGEVLKFETGTIHKPYVNYRKWGSIEVCTFCHIELKEKEHKRSY